MSHTPQHQEDPDDYLDQPQMRKFGRLSRQMRREWQEPEQRDKEDGEESE